MLLIADCGSTKVDWRAIEADGTVKSVNTQGINPVFLSTEDVIKILTEFNFLFGNRLIKIAEGILCHLFPANRMIPEERQGIPSDPEAGMERITVNLLNPSAQKFHEHFTRWDDSFCSRSNNSSR